MLVTVWPLWSPTSTIFIHECRASTFKICHQHPKTSPTSLLPSKWPLHKDISGCSHETSWTVDLSRYDQLLVKMDGHSIIKLFFELATFTSVDYFLLVFEPSNFSVRPASRCLHGPFAMSDYFSFRA